MTFDELNKKCKAAISLDVNQHKNYYQSVEEYLRDFSETGDIEIELWDRMVKENTIYRLQFYPLTPIGFYVVWGTSLEEVLRAAEDCFEPVVSNSIG